LPDLTLALELPDGTVLEGTQIPDDLQITEIVAEVIEQLDYPGTD
jgi:hypothetical protein